MLGLDYAAVPDWFQALKHDQGDATRLAEAILSKCYFTFGYSYPEDVMAGIQDPHSRIAYWSIMLTKYLQHQNDKDAMIPHLERHRDGNNDKLADAAANTLLAITQSESDSV